jgi:signal transduction histidine kinase
MKRDVQLASGIMLFSLIGLLAFQAYWISSIYRENKFTFESDLQATLASANKSLLIQKLGLMGGLDINFSDNNSVSVTISDSVSFGDSTSIFDVRTKFSQHYIIDDSQLHQDTPHEDKPETTSYVFKGQFGSQTIDSVFSKSYNSTISYGDFFYLDSLVKDKLEEKGLKEKYFLGFWNNNIHRFEYSNQAIGDSTIRGNGYSTQAFAIGQEMPDEIYLELPEKHVIRASLAGMGQVITASVLMLVLLLSAWYYIIRSLQKQYRLAQIKDDFIGNMTHELKTPVTASSIALEVMAKNEKIDSDQKLKDLLGIAQDEQKRILQIVNSILDNTSSEESISENIELIDVNEEVEAITESMRLKIEDRGGKLNLAISKTVCSISANRMHFQNAFLNILDNALKYSPGVPEISVTMNSTPTEMEIQIKDEGVGIASDDIKRVFDKFFRVHTGNVHTVKGYGLGLSYTESVIRQFGGSISIKSTVGMGSTFIVKIPIDRQ